MKSLRLEELGLWSFDWREEKPSRHYRSVQNGEATVVCSMESIL